MIEVRKTTEITKEYRIEFLKDGCGCSFPCDEKGTIDFESMAPEGKENYEHCITHPELFDIFNKLNMYTHKYTERVATCHCGEEISIYDEYRGACQCPHCGKWYNLFGQELNPPETWEEDW